MSAFRMIIVAALLLGLPGCSGCGGDAGQASTPVPFAGARTFEGLVPPVQTGTGESSLGFEEGATLVMDLVAGGHRSTLAGTVTSSDGLLEGAALGGIAVRPGGFAARATTTSGSSLHLDGTFVAAGMMLLMDVSDDAGNRRFLPVAGHGMEAPDFDAADTAGNPVHLADFREVKDIVLVFYRGKT